MKKIISCVIVILMYLGITFVNVQAEDSNTYTDHEYTYKIDNSKATIVKCATSARGSIEIPSHFNGYPVTAIADYAFNNCSNIFDITIPKTVNNIGTAPFYYCSNLEEIILESGNSAYSVKDGILFNKDYSTLIACPQTKAGKYTIPNSVTTIDKYAFNSCSALTEIIITNNVKEIKSNAFAECSGIQKIVIPDNVTIIGDYAFDNCTSLNDITISNNVTRIEEFAFYKCPITEIEIPDSVVYIGGQSFGRTNLISITIPANIERIENSTFYCCESLKSVIFSGNIPEIESDYYAFTSTPDDLVIYYNEGAKNSTTSWINGSWFSKKVEMIPSIPLTINNIDAISSNCIKVTVSNPTGIDIPSLCIVSLYENDRPVEIKLEGKKIIGKTEAEIMITFNEEFNDSKNSLQVYVWKDFETLRPMAINKAFVIK